MCKKCFVRSAIILTAALSGQPFPSETADESEAGHRWTGQSLDATKAIIQTFSEYPRDGSVEADAVSPDVDLIDKKIGSILEGMSVSELNAINTLCDAMRRHFVAVKNLARAEITERAGKGDQEAISLVADAITDDVSGAIKSVVQELMAKGMGIPMAPSASGGMVS